MAHYRHKGRSIEVQVGASMNCETGAPAVVILVDGHIHVGLDLTNAEAIGLGRALLSLASMPQHLRDLAAPIQHLNS